MRKRLSFLKEGVVALRISKFTGFCPELIKTRLNSKSLEVRNNQEQASEEWRIFQDISPALDVSHLALR